MIQRLIALILLLILSPLYIILALIVFYNDGFPIIFKQRCFGLNDQVFTLFKFRTMKKTTPKIPTENFTDENKKEYILKHGPFFRKLSLDELPQLYNVVIGNMNFVGPRPCMYENEDILLSLRKEKKINTIKPGITGWAQVNGRDNNNFQKKVELDFYYFNNRSFWMDFYILVKTFYVVFSRTNIRH